MNRDESFEVVWAGGDLTASLDRDYAAMNGDGWDLVWTPTSPLTTPWDAYAHMCLPDPDAYVPTALECKPRYRRGAFRVLKDWSREYQQQGSRR